VSVVEVTTFRLGAGADDEAFLRSDRRVQNELVPNRPGFLRRTTARDGASWVVVVLWASRSDASAADEATRGQPVRTEFEAHLEPGSARAQRYETLD
jgi:hypothetical protein